MTEQGKTDFSFHRFKMKNIKGTSTDNHFAKHTSVHRDQLLTIGDLEDFKNTLFDEIKNLLKEANGQQAKKWLRSSEVRKMLGVSPGTLQNLRINRILTFSKVGGIVFYKHEDIISLLETNCNPKGKY